MTTLAQMKVKSESRLQEEKRQIDRRRHTVTLITRFLVDNGYTGAAETLQSESGLSLSRFDVVENIDLPFIIQEFESYYEMKLGRKPVLVRRVAKEPTPRGGGGGGGAGDRGTRPGGRGRRPPRSRPRGDGMVSGGDDPSPKAAASGGTSGDEGGGDGGDDPFAIAGKKVTPKAGGRGAGAGAGAGRGGGGAGAADDEPRMLKPLGSFSSSPELLELAGVISRDIYQHNPNVRWDDVVELDAAKRLLKEAVVMPIKYPQLFTGLLTPWRGILLFGPPGTGKTMLARAVATECRTTFFNISASSIVSKWRGDSEKLIRVLFELARHHAPSTIFLDELDSIMGQRGSGGSNEHEASRRMKTELLIQMDGLNKTNDLVFVLAASNLPWELDMAMLRRLEKRVLVDLPGPSAREMMLRKKLPEDRCAELDYKAVAAKLEGYSGSDITLLAKETSMRPVRRLMDKLEALEESSAGGGGAPTVVGEELVKLDPVTPEDLDAALAVTRPSARLFADKYTAWQAELGST